MSMESANIGRSLAMRVGLNIREVRTKLGLTQAQLAAPEFSVSYISAIERGKIRPSLKALAILAKRLDVPLAYLLEGSPAGAADARAVGYPEQGEVQEQKTDLALEKAQVYMEQGNFDDAEEILKPIAALSASKITTLQALQLYMLQGRLSIERGEYQIAVTDFNRALQQADAIGERVSAISARDMLGKAYHNLGNTTLALGVHEECITLMGSTGSEFADPLLAARINQHLAEDLSKLGLYDEAMDKLELANELNETFGGTDPRLNAVQMAETANRYEESGNFTQAQTYMTWSAGIYAMLKVQRQFWNTQLDLGRLYRAKKQFTEAEDVFEAVMRGTGNDVEFTDIKSQAYILLAELELEKGGDISVALNYADLAVSSAGIRKSLAKAQALLARGNVLSRFGGKEKETDQMFLSAFELLTGKNLREAFRAFAMVLELRSDITGALVYQKMALELKD